MTGKSKHKIIRLPKNRYLLIQVLFWTIFICSSLWLNLFITKKTVIDLAYTEANAYFTNNIIFRRWVADHGGVYASVSSKTPPNPYLSLVSERDITTPSGRKLTIINPAYMTRQVHDLSMEKFGIRAHITSLTPIRPENRADPWESNALKSFKNVESEHYSLEVIEGVQHFRFMRPLITEKTCLKCHAFQGYEEGDIRGGISVSIPIRKFHEIIKPYNRVLAYGHVLFWVIGILIIAFVSRFINRNDLNGEPDTDKISTSKLTGNDITDSNRALRNKEGDFTATRTTTRKMFLILFIPLFLISGLVAAVPLYFEYESRKVVLNIQQSQHVDKIKETLKVEIKAIISDLMVLSAYPELHSMLHSYSESTRSTVEEAFLAFSANKGKYDQVRFLNDKGLEQVRVDYNRGMPSIVPQEKLQDKSKRYYFNDTFILGSGEVYVSPMDLNIERGKVEIPFKPMVRFGTPVFDHRGRKQGIVQLNYLAEQLLFKIIKDYDRPDGQVMLLNSDGYWLKGPNQEDEWGFMFEDKQEVAFAYRYPDDWKRISWNDFGQFTSKKGLFTFASVHPLVEGIKSSTGSGHAFKPSERQLNAKEYIWKIVTFIPRDSLVKSMRNTLIRWFPVYLVLMLLLAFTSWRWAVARQKKEAANNAVRELNKNLEHRVAQEIADRGEKEQLLIQQSKMAAMGEMIGAIAHQWRQPLNALGIIVQDIRDAYEFGELDEKYINNTVNESLNQIQFMSKTIDDFRNFYKISKDKETFSIIDAIESVISLQEAQLKHNRINIRINSGKPQSPSVTGYTNEFKQVILNIIGNARSAILEAREEGLLSEERSDILINILQEEETVIISISNQGKQIPVDIMDRIFEPYFTTKKTSEGTGIGLYMSKTIIEKNMEGKIYANNIENGVAFTIELPEN